MSFIFPSLRLNVILLFFALTAYAQMQERVAIINTLDDYDSISVSALTYLTDRLRETAVNVLPAERFGIMTTESIVAFLGSMENTVRVCKESSCLAELGRQVSADYVAQGRIGRFNDNLTIKVELYSVISGNLMGSFTGSSKDVSGLLALIEEKSADLFKRMLAEPKAPKPPEPSIAVVPNAPPVLQPTPSKTVDPADIQTLIKKDIDKYKEKIQEESLYLSHGDRIALYKENEKKWAALGYGMLNMFTLGSGLGSYIQGDIALGVVHSTLALVSVVLFIPVIRESNAADAAFDGTDEANERQLKANDRVIAYGLIVLAHAFVSGVTPVLHQSRYNKALREALNIDEGDIFSIAPLIVPKNGTPAVGLAFNVRY